MRPAVGHDLLVPRQLRDRLVQLRLRNAHRAANVAAREGFPSARVHQNEIERIRLHRLEYVVPFFFGVELLSKVIAVGLNQLRFDGPIFLLRRFGCGSRRIG